MIVLLLGGGEEDRRGRGGRGVRGGRGLIWERRVRRGRVVNDI
jgi:hypothetical protein